MGIKSNIIFIFAVLIPISCTSKENNNALNLSESHLYDVGYKPLGGWANLFNMKLIQLNKKNGEQGCFAQVDDEDYELINNLNWSKSKGGKNYYAVRYFEEKRISMHVFIMKSKKGQIIDHKDGNGLNNQKSNLRFCTHKQNISNGKSRAGTSKYLGVSYDKVNNKWAAQIMENRIQIKIGRFKTEIEAALAYNERAKKLRGEFARLNII